MASIIDFPATFRKQIALGKGSFTMTRKIEAIRLMIASFALVILSASCVHAEPPSGLAVSQLTPPTLTPSLQDPTGKTPVVETPVAPANAVAKAIGQTLPQWRGQYGGGPEFSTEIKTTEARWSQLWRRLDKEVPQRLDPAREMAIFIAIGKRPTGGYKVQVLSATVKGNQLVVKYTDGKPSSDTYVTQAVTNPWVVAVIPKTSLPVMFENID